MRTDRRTWRAKFRDSFRGIAVGLEGQSSFVVHVGAAVLVVLAGAYFRVSVVEWALLALSIAVVFVAELLNTSIEWLAQVATSQHDPRIGNALDVASAAVLLTAAAAALVGAIIFVPRILALLAGGF